MRPSLLVNGAKRAPLASDDGRANAITRGKRENFTPKENKRISIKTHILVDNLLRSELRSCQQQRENWMRDDLRKGKC